MTLTSFARPLGAALLGLATTGAARADIGDYAFQLVESEVGQGEADLSVRLIDKRTSKPVPGAVIFATRIDMAPDGMETMSSTIRPAPSSEPGVYRFTVRLTMAGGWRLSLAAKVQGEAGTVSDRLTFKAAP